MTHQSDIANKSEWFAIKTMRDFKAETVLAPYCEEVFFPTFVKGNEAGRSRKRAAIPHVLFIKTTRENALQLESDAQKSPELLVPFWIYRYPKDNKIQVIPPSSINLLRLLTSSDTDSCEIFLNKEFKENERVRITGGIYSGYEGNVVRVKKNKHVLVKIEGVCMVLLPFIHPDLLEPVHAS